VTPATTNSQASLRVEQALRLLPDVDGLAPLRAFVVSLSAARGPQAWTAAEPNRTIGKRALDPTELRARVPQVIARVTGRVGELYTAAVDALESERNGEFSKAVLSLLRAGQCEEQDGRFAQAEAWYQQALRIAEQLRDRGPEIETLAHLGRLQAARGYFEDGARAFQRSLALAEAEGGGDRVRAAAACRGLGDVLCAQTQWAGAEAWYTRGLQHAHDCPAQAAALWLGLGNTAHRRGQPATAADRLHRALEIYESLGDTAGTIGTLLARGALEAAQGRPAAVLATYREALGRLPVAGADPALEIAVRLRLADHYLDAGRLPDAEDEARRAEELAITHQLSRLLARVYVLMGRMRGRQGDENGFVFFEQAIELGRGGGGAGGGGQPDGRLEADVYREYAIFRTALGDRHEARAYLSRARELLEPFGDAAALERIDEELRQLDFWMLTDGAPSAPHPR
jgi:tetratricopeptide (TPR) repeat protein